MKTKLRQLGDSQAVIITSKILKEAGLNKGAEVNISVENGCIHLTPVRERKSFAGTLTKKQGRELDNHIKTIRNEWK